MSISPGFPHISFGTTKQSVGIVINSEAPPPLPPPPPTPVVAPPVPPAPPVPVELEMAAVAPGPTPTPLDTTDGDASGEEPHPAIATLHPTTIPLTLLIFLIVRPAPLLGDLT